jgi:hypothetical protein
MRSSTSIWDAKGPLHLSRLINCSSTTAMKLELKSLISIDHFWREFFNSFNKRESQNEASHQYIHGLKVWHKTNIAKLQHQTASTSMTHRMLRQGMPKSLTVIDCGTGDGTLTLRFLKTLKMPKTASLEIVLIDQSTACLNASKASLRSHFPLLQISSRKSRIENVSIDSLIDPSRFSLAIFSSVLHELPPALRAELVKRWCRHVDVICISEIEGNHDKSERETAAYARSVWRFYRQAYDEVMFRRGLTKSEKLLCVRSIIMPEVIRIVRNESAPTIDRHFRLSDARTDFEKAGGTIEWRSATSPSGLKAFTVLISRKRS